MKAEYQEFFCQEVRRLWLDAPKDARPWGVWLALHAPTQPPDYTLMTDVLAAWFLDRGRFSERRPSEFVRFRIVQSGRYWSSTMMPPSSGVFRVGTHEIGIAGFARVGDCDEYYFEWQFGGCFGCGATYVRDESGHLRRAKTVFIS